MYSNQSYVMQLLLVIGKMQRVKSHLQMQPRAGKLVAVVRKGHLSALHQLQWSRKRKETLTVQHWKEGGEEGQG